MPFQCHIKGTLIFVWDLTNAPRGDQNQKMSDFGGHLVPLSQVSMPCPILRAPNKSNKLAERNLVRLKVTKKAFGGLLIKNRKPYRCLFNALSILKRAFGWPNRL